MLQKWPYSEAVLEVWTPAEIFSKDIWKMSRTFFMRIILV